MRGKRRKALKKLAEKLNMPLTKSGMRKLKEEFNREKDMGAMVRTVFSLPVLDGMKAFALEKPLDAGRAIGSL